MHDMGNSSQQSVAGSQQPFMDDGSATLYQGDCLDVLRRLPSESVHCCVTSPPYFGLRDYGTATWDISATENTEIAEKCDHVETFRPHKDHDGRDFGVGRGDEEAKATTKIGYRDECGKCGAVRIDAQIGLEATPAEFVAKMVEVFTEVHRVLRKDGTLWLNLGDSYSSNAGGYDANGSRGATSHPAISRNTQAAVVQNRSRVPFSGLKPKDLMGMPWRVAFALQEAGWWLRQDIIWSKPNPMPESVTDRCTKAHEYIFLLSKSAKYFYDAEAIKEPNSSSNNPRFLGTRGNLQTTGARNGDRDFSGGFPYDDAGRNKRSVWTVTTQPYSEAHFATFPPKLIEPCVLAGTSEKGCCASCCSPYERVSVVIGKQVTEAMKIAGCDANGEYHGQATKDYESAQAQNASDTKRRILEKMSQITESGWQKTCKCETDEISPAVVLDPFGGAGTTLLVAKRLGRKSVGIELNPEYCKLIERRLEHWHKPSPPKAVDDSFVGTLFEGIDQEVAA